MKYAFVFLGLILSAHSHAETCEALDMLVGRWEVVSGKVSFPHDGTYSDLAAINGELELVWGAKGAVSVSSLVRHEDGLMRIDTGEFFAEGRRLIIRYSNGNERAVVGHCADDGIGLKGGNAPYGWPGTTPGSHRFKILIRAEGIVFAGESFPSDSLHTQPNIKYEINYRRPWRYHRHLQPLQAELYGPSNCPLVDYKLR